MQPGVGGCAIVGAAMPSSDTASVEPEPRRGGQRTHAFLTLVLQADDPLRPGVRWSLDGVERVDLCRGPGRSETESRKLRLELGDRSISSNHAQLRKVGTRWRVKDLQSK